MRTIKRSSFYRKLYPVRRIVRPIWRWGRRNLFQIRFSSLARRIIVTNLVALLVFLGGILYLDQKRAQLMGVKAASLFAQGEMIARTIAWAAAVKTDEVVIGPESILDAQNDSQTDVPLDPNFGLESFPIDPERAAPLLQRIVKPTGTRARIYDKEGTLLLDTRWLYSQGQVIKRDVPPIEPPEPKFWSFLKKWFTVNVLGYNNPTYRDIGSESGRAYQEVRTALMGTASQALMLDDTGEHVVVVTVPIQHFRAVLGVLMLSTSGKDITEAIAKDRKAVIYLSLLAAGITLVLSLWLASTIASPMHRLAAAAEAVRRSIKTRRQIPDLTYRGDEIGHLSGTLRAMTDALYRRLDAIESFAADVSHELKNPLTSLRSAVETLPLAKKEEDRERLIEVILHDVQRLDRLITDISDASRLDAELALKDAKPVNLVEMLQTIVPVFNDLHREGSPKVELDIETIPDFPEAFVVNGHDSRLGQVLTNLLDNAISFSPKDGRVRVRMRREEDEILIQVDDQGPGIPPNNLEKIFKRFYTDRPGADNFGNNSGLGLNISRQIVNAHGGRIWAENLPRRLNGHDAYENHDDQANNAENANGGQDGHGSRGANGSSHGKDHFGGARFSIRLPAAVKRPAQSGGWLGKT